MDFRLTKEEEVFQQEVDEFMKKELTQDVVEESNQGLGPAAKTWEFLGKLGAKGWLVPMLPKEYGGLGGTWMQKYIIDDALDYHFFPEPFAFIGGYIVAPMLMMIGNEEQKKEYVPKIASGEMEFALGYSEPEAGSDTANIDIRVVEDGDYYVMNGQKIFNTSCHYAHYHWLCARTEVTTPKHRGLSLFIVPMDTPGISLSPLWAISGERTNAVYYDNVRVPKSSLVGEKNRGFYHMMAALNLERLFPTGHIRRGLSELIKYIQTTTRNGKPLAEDPLVKQRVAELTIRVEAAESLGYRVTWMLQNGKVPDYESSVNKVFITETEQEIAYTGLKIMGLYGQLKGGPHAPVNGELAHFFLAVARRTVTGGTNEIQRNIIAYRGFNLPRA